jgi:DNA-directed RNA polymerase specialized sigma24 family protein
MFQREKLSDVHAYYASQADFCEVFEKDMKSLYLLAFMLTGNHQVAEQCFAATFEDTSRSQYVFKDWVRSWVTRSLIKNAINLLSPASLRSGEKAELWSAAKDELCEINAVTQLKPLDRFVFVMSILERYSVRDCALLLGCSTTRVVRSRIRALRRLPGPNNMFAGGEGWSSRCLGATA